MPQEVLIQCMFEFHYAVSNKTDCANRLLDQELRIVETAIFLSDVRIVFTFDDIMIGLFPSRYFFSRMNIKFF